VPYCLCKATQSLEITTVQCAKEFVSYSHLFKLKQLFVTNLSSLILSRLTKFDATKTYLSMDPPIYVQHYGTSCNSVLSLRLYVVTSFASACVYPILAEQTNLSFVTTCRDDNIGILELVNFGPSQYTGSAFKIY